MTDLMELAKFMEERPDLPQPIAIYLSAPSKPADAKAAVDLFLHGGGVVHKATCTYDEGRIELTRTFGKITLQLGVYKSSLGCQKVAVQKTVEEWQCGPILDAIAEVAK